ncbi:redoxin domain-containing protein [Chitinophaga agrisoli]|uniref:Redoxin domain-containing protein n=1 Tax=Chitinophaga agrisoli TaxID=2607653 RepID=A0A5B2VL71_9BACT|nr:metallophosphoesterase [Chitinophaga agrisoli]KAA2239735.1 redoxin domain-containing protein [Chitinophaga agrisoli]
MIRKVLFFLAMLLCPLLVNAQKGKIVIEGNFTTGYKVDTVLLEYFNPDDLADYHFSDLKTEYKSEAIPLTKGRFKKVVYTDRPVAVKIFCQNPYSINRLRGPINRFASGFMEPGDSLHLVNDADNIRYMGKGATNFIVWGEISKVHYKPDPPIGFSLLQRYLFFSQQCDSIAMKKQKIMNKYKDGMTAVAFTYLNGNMISLGEQNRAEKFGILVYNRKKVGLSDADLVRIYDTTIGRSAVVRLPVDDNTMLNQLADFYCSPFSRILYQYTEGFKDSFFNQDLVEQNVGLYYFIRNNYSGLARAKMLTTILTVYMLRKGGTNPEYLSCVDDFMSIPGYFKQKKYVKKYVEGSLRVEEGAYAPFFSLTDVDGKKFSLTDLKGKVVFMDFWFTGCTGCTQIVPALTNIEKAFEDNPNVAFVSISIDEDKKRWIESINRGKYTTGKGINLYTEGEGGNHSVLESYNVSSYPRFFLIDAEGKIAFYPAPSPLVKNGEILGRMIKQKVAEIMDGPYLVYDDSTIVCKTVTGSDRGKSIVREEIYNISQKEQLLLPVMTDMEDRGFKVKLKQKLTPEPTVFEMPSSLMVLSDIEGNFEAFRELLQSNGVIDQDYNWTFGNGHLVLAGDFFDRGKQVTEVLWLIYLLEQKAREKGGYVHFVLGNHEIMNLNGDLRYVQQKYHNNARILGSDYQSLWGKDSELGRWLRTKNIIEKIGDLLVCHGGISSNVNGLDISLESINASAREYYDREHEIGGNEGVLNVLYNKKYSPFWYRGYYNENEASLQQIDSTLKKFGVRKIVTGHTINQSGTIGVYYGGRVINTDTEHAKRKSEALLIENGEFFRVNRHGERRLLISDGMVVR